MAKHDLQQILTELKTLVGEELKVNCQCPCSKLSGFNTVSMLSGNASKLPLLIAVYLIQVDSETIQSSGKYSQADTLSLC